MFAYEPNINPPCDEWKDYRLPQLCKSQIERICEDILKRGQYTNYTEIYDLLYQAVEEKIEEEDFHKFEF